MSSISKMNFKLNISKTTASKTIQDQMKKVHFQNQFIKDLTV